VCVVANVALLGRAVQVTTELGGDAEKANDGLGNTASCTKDDQEQPWWAIDLKHYYEIDSIHITFSETRNYRWSFSIHYFSFILWTM